MNEQERAFKDIEKLKGIISEFQKLKLSETYLKILEWATNYMHDSEHFYKKKDYYSAFGAANYAYGIIDAILIIEGKKT